MKPGSTATAAAAKDACVARADADCGALAGRAVGHTAKLVASMQNVGMFGKAASQAGAAVAGLVLENTATDLSV